MTVGISAVNLANKWLDVLGASTFTGITNVYVKLHIGDPGSAGASNPSAVTTRVVVAWAAASAGSKSINGTLPSWSMTTSETISHISLWDNISAGNFLDAITLTASQAVVNTNTLNLTALTIALTPIAA